MIKTTHFKLVVSTIIADVADVASILKLHLIALSAHHNKHPARLVRDAFVSVGTYGDTILSAKYQHRLKQQITQSTKETAWDKLHMTHDT